MTGTSVLHPTSDADHVLDTPLYHKTKASAASNETLGGLHMISERDEEGGGSDQQQDRDTVRQQYENMTYDDLAQRMAENYKQLSAVLGTNALNVMRESTSSTTRDEKEEDDSSRAAAAEPGSSSSSNSSNGDELDDEDDEGFLARDDLDDKMKRAKMTKVFCRAASTGDVDKVNRLLGGRQRAYIDVDARDEDGTTPLIYAACFGKVEIAQALLDAGAKTDVQDSYGWSALMWATNSNQDALVKVLLENGASAHTKSAKGRTVFDFVNTDNQKIVEILATNPRDSVSSTSSILGRAAGSMSSTSSSAGDCDFYYQSTLEGYDSFMAEEADRRRKLLETAMALADPSDHVDGEFDHLDNGLDDDDDTGSDDLDEPSEFVWDKCLPDQMFVFSDSNLQYILDTIITDIQLPVRSRQEICVPANVVFLSARFAHYFSGDELLQKVMHGAVERISTEIKSNARNVHILAFWITNATQLLYYLKKDVGLVVATAEHQLRISELVSEIYSMIIYDAERRLAKILTPAMLEHEMIPGMEDVNFADDWQRFFRRSSRRSVVVPPDGGLAVQMKRSSSARNSIAMTAAATSACAAHAISPQSITSLLTSTLYVLQSYDVHPAIIVQALAQFFHYMSCELFNRILTNKKLLCRSKALQIRMNMSQIEDWITQEHLPSSLASYLEPTNQLLQLLQCLTHLQDLVSFIHTVKKFDALNALQVKRCVTNYRYEVNEPGLSEEVEKYAIQLAEDTVRFKQTRSIEQLRKKRSSTAMARTQSVSLQRSRSRRESVTNFVGSIMSSVGISTSNSLPPTLPSEHDQHRTSSENDEEQLQKPSSANNNAPSTVSQDKLQPVSDKDENEEEDDDRQKDVKETRDSKFMLPFSVPTTAHMVSITGWAPDNTKRQERMISPVIPDEWMDRLDNASGYIE